jgi:hypothetical protein
MIELELNDAEREGLSAAVPIAKDFARDDGQSQTEIVG